MKLSVIIITKNEATAIRSCLDSISWAAEIIIVDSGSTDDTLSICREYTEAIFVADWPGFGPQKNRALEHASGDWILSIDADERISSALKAEIEAVITKNDSNVAYSLPRLSKYCGRPIHHSSWWPDFVTRLFQRGNAWFSNDLVHERLIVNGPIGKLTHHLIHDSFENFEEVLEKLNNYSSAGAQMMYQEKRTAGLLTALSHAFWTFLHTYIIRLGFLDGKEGFMLAVSNAEGTYYKYLKLMLLSKRNNGYHGNSDNI